MSSVLRWLVERLARGNAAFAELNARLAERGAVSEARNYLELERLHREAARLRNRK